MPSTGIGEFTQEFFTDSSNAWKENKICIGNCYYVYKCKYIHSNGKLCTKPVESSKKDMYAIRPDWAKKDPSGTYCKKHRFLDRYEQ
jgi:hypothetical protein